MVCLFVLCRGLGINLYTADVVIFYDSDWVRLACTVLLIARGFVAHQKTLVNHV